MGQNSSRRTVLTSVGSGLAVVLAGCSSLEGDVELDAENDSDESSEGFDVSIERSTESADVSDDAGVAVVEPADGEVVSGDVSVVLEAENVSVEPAGEATDGAGHFHVLIDTDPVEPGAVVPDDDRHVHLDDGSNETVLDLEPGDHRLVVQLGDGDHRAYDVTDAVEVTVEE